MPSTVSKDWKSLNDQLREADEGDCRRLLSDELNGRRRQRYLLRIHSRLNYVRAHRERAFILRGEQLDG